MALAVNFRWKTPQQQQVRSDWEKDGWGEGLDKMANTIANVKRSRYEKAQTERRNAIEDEDRRRRMEEEDRRKRVYGEAADMMRGKAEYRANLVRQAEALRSEIEQLKAQVGG